MSCNCNNIWFYHVVWLCVMEEFLCYIYLINLGQYIYGPALLNLIIPYSIQVYTILVFVMIVTD